MGSRGAVHLHRHHSITRIVADTPPGASRPVEPGLQSRRASVGARTRPAAPQSPRVLDSLIPCRRTGCPGGVQEPVINRAVSRAVRTVAHRRNPYDDIPRSRVRRPRTVQRSPLRVHGARELETGRPAAPAEEGARRAARDCRPRPGSVRCHHALLHPHRADRRSTSSTCRSACRGRRRDWPRRCASWESVSIASRSSRTRSPIPWCTR